MSHSPFRTLGRSGLVVSPLALGTMTFGTQRWGSPDDVSQAIFDAYIAAEGNFIDTADVYAGGRSEEIVGGLVADRQLRDKLVLATKFTWNNDPGNPNAGGNGRKNIYRALEGSLRRLKTDYVDMYWLHAWDMVTPVEEVLQTLGDLVRAGKIRYFGFSNMPAWYTTKAATLAQVHGVPGPIALQMAYSLVERNLEHEFRPAAREGGLSITPWSPLAAGFLAGKYQPTETGATGEGRLMGANPFGNTLFTKRNWEIVEVLRTVAAEANRPMAQVALAWVLAQPGVVAPIIGASKLPQLHDNLAALAIRLTPEQLQTLNEGSAPEQPFPYGIFTPQINQSIFGGKTVQGWQ
ncbi:aldo/keto reductase [Hymenobacter sp. BT186]|uniref:Aldo/keto reductase n=1 Tax=Hymenobacter telluris TaxID=2816474 RepID=A0A939J8C5_9BACT|nr:aldo/keto reductase [Hymenobacter telluris]MBO0357609.1 aldo/keto reductase [Hymenobacter telluris]MBW3373635.1 aldo/keto reductase [Hymenobacter norwichensis]